MDEVVYYNDLYDLYGELLTDKQRKYFEDYYFDNLSFSEMAEDYDVSRNATFKQVHLVCEKLEELENKLHLLEKKNKILEISNHIENDKIKEELENLF